MTDTNPQTPTPDDEILDLQAEDQVSDIVDNDPADAAVDDIIKRESDELLKKEDEKNQTAIVVPRSRWQRIVESCKEFWADRTKRNRTLAGLAIFLVVFFAIPFTRYGFFNVLGVRASAQVRVVDNETRLPLKNVTVKIDGKEALTDIDGNANIERIKLGSRAVVITKLAYADVNTKTTIGFGGNSLPEQSIEATGARYTFSVQDWLSKAAIEKAEAEFGENNAISDSSGLIILTIPPTEENKVEVIVRAEGYADKTVEITTETTESTSVNLVVATPQFYLSNRDGTFGVYKSSADGEDEELVIEGTGRENAELIRFSVDPTNTKAVLVATRDDIKNDDGYLLSGLYTIDLASGEIEKRDESERIDLVGWADGAIVYVKIAAGASGTNAQRHRLNTFNVDTGVMTELAASNYFNDVLVAQNYILYAPSSAYNENKTPYLFRVKADGSDLQTIFEREVWSIIQTEYDSIVFDSKQEWFRSGITVLYANPEDSAPGNRVSRLYTSSPEGSKAAWVDNRDGKGVLLLHDVATSEDSDLVRLAGLRQPLRWLSDKHIVFRVVSQDETADYVVNVEGGEPQKIRDVADVPGVDRWYYYY